MKLKAFTLFYDADSGGFDDAALQVFLSNRQVLAVHEHFFVHEQRPVWALLVSYRDIEKRGAHRSSPKETTDPRAELDQEEQARYDALRQWRNERSRRDGRPPFVLLTNRQLAALARNAPSTLEGLREIEGIGDAKVASLGGDILGILAALRGPAEGGGGASQQKGAVAQSQTAGGADGA